MQHLMVSQCKSRHRVMAMVHHHQPGLPFSQSEEEGIQILRLPILTKLVFVPLALTARRYFRQYIIQESPDVLHLHMPNVSCFWLLFLSEAKRIPWVIHWHSDVLGAAPDWKVKFLYPLYRIFEKALLRRANAIIVTSPAYLESSSALADFTHKCVVIPLGIEDLPTSAPKPVRQQDAPLKLLCIGRLTYYKGHDYLLSAIKTLQAQGRAVHLTLVGSGELAASIKSRLNKDGLADIVTMKSELSDQQVASELYECDVLCLPSIERTEAFGVVLLEAMRAAKPCIVTDVPGSGMSWVVQHGKTGLVVKAADANSLANAIAEFDLNREMLFTMGKTGRARYVSYFTVDRVASEIDGLYERVAFESRQ